MQLQRVRLSLRRIPRTADGADIEECSMHYRTFLSDTGSPESEEWHAWRRQGIGGSDAVILAVSEGLVTEAPSWVKSIDYLWREKRGLPVEKVAGSFAIRRGKAGEEIARNLYVEQFGIFVLPAFGENEERPFVRSSFDGLDIFESVIAEVKCPGAANHRAAHEGVVIDYYKPQLAHQALTAWGHPDIWLPDRELHYISCCPEDRDIAVVRHRCTKYARIAAALWDIEEVFWAKVLSGEPPGGWDLHALCRSYLEAERVYISRKAEADAAKSVASAAMAAVAACKEDLERAFLATGQRKLEAEGLSLSKSQPKAVVPDVEAALLALGYTLEQLAPFRAMGSIAYDRMGAELDPAVVEQYRQPGPLDGKAAIEGLGVPADALAPYLVEPPPRITMRRVDSKAEAATDPVPA